jgi:hypothetical protein
MPKSGDENSKSKHHEPKPNSYSLALRARAAATSVALAQMPAQNHAKRNAPVAATATALAVRKEIRRTRVNDSTLPLNSFFLRPLLRKVCFVCANLWH